jgi:hypothetical protein
VNPVSIERLIWHIPEFGSKVRHLFAVAWLVTVSFSRQGWLTPNVERQTKRAAQPLNERHFYENNWCGTGEDF